MLQGVSRGRSESLGDVTELTTCACAALLGAAEGLIWLAVSAAGATPLSSAERLILWECVLVFGRLCSGLVSTGRLSASPPPWLAGCVCSAAWSEETTSALPLRAATSPALSLRACSVFPSAECFPLVAVFLGAVGAAEALEAAPDFGEAFSEDVSVVPLGLGPDLAVAADDCLEGAKEAFTGLAVDLAAVPVAEGGFVIFFLGASLVALSAAEDLEPSLLSSFLGEAVFFTVDPCLETWWSGVPLPLVSALAAAAPVDPFSVAPALTLAPSLTFDLVEGLLLFVVSVFCAAFVDAVLFTTFAWSLGFAPGMAWVSLRGLPAPFSGEALPDVDEALG